MSVKSQLQPQASGIIPQHIFKRVSCHFCDKKFVPPSLDDRKAMDIVCILRYTVLNYLSIY